MSLGSLLYTLSSKYILTICLSNTNNRNSTLDYVFNNSRMTVQLIARFFMFLLKITFYTILSSLLPPKSMFFYTVDTLPCFKQLLLPAAENHLCIITGVTVVSCCN